MVLSVVVSQFVHKQTSAHTAICCLPAYLSGPSSCIIQKKKEKKCTGRDNGGLGLSMQGGQVAECKYCCLLHVSTVPSSPAPSSAPSDGNRSLVILKLGSHIAQCTCCSSHQAFELQ
jgi:hypothetical protein